MRFRPDNQKFARLYRSFLYRLVGGMVLLLTTTGRRSGKPHTVGLQYEWINGAYWVGAADGPRADWYRNAQSQPRVEIQVGEHCTRATFKALEEPGRVAEFLAHRLKKRPLLMRLILRQSGLRGPISPPLLLAYARQIRAAVIIPDSSP